MLGFIKNLFGMGSEDKKTPSTPPSATPAAKPQPVAAAPTASAPTAAPTGETIEVSLKGVLDGLPPELKGLVTAQPAAGATIKVSVQRVKEGLPKGSVKITYAELKAQAGPGFGGDASLDQTPISLPLKEVLSKIKPSQFTRRSDQKTIDIPDDIKPVFGADGSSANAAAAAAQAAAASAPAPAPTPAPPPAPVAPAPVAKAAPAPAPVMPPPAPAPTPAPAAPKAPAPAPAPAAEEAAPIKSSMALPDPASLRPAAAAPKPAPAAPAPAESGPIKMSMVPTPAAPAPSAPVTVPTATTPSAGGTLSAIVDTVFANWPEDLKGELGKHNAAGLSLSLPLDQVEPMMRKGKILFTWSQLRAWITPAIPGTLSSNRDAENLELPLKIIIPLFMAARKPGASTQKTIAVDKNIPDVFAGKSPAPAAAAVPAAAPAPASPAPAAAPAPAPTPAAAAPAPATGPTDLVTKVAAFANVLGVVLASPEGLKVAAQLPPEYNADAFAGFVVAMFSRMNQFTGDLKLGEPQVVSVQTNSRNLVIIKSGRTFLAVIGKPDASLAIDDLKKLAATLS